LREEKHTAANRKVAAVFLFALAAIVEALAVASA
jgi:hypothetical protein